jgi:hypothetical protein
VHCPFLSIWTGIEGHWKWQWSPTVRVRLSFLKRVKQISGKFCTNGYPKLRVSYWMLQEAEDIISDAPRGY